MTKTNQKIPEGWSVKKLGECTLSFSGGTPSVDKTEYYENGKIPFIRSGEIYQDFTELFITKKGLKESSAKMVKKGDLLLALYGANSGDSSVCKIDGAINQAILCIRTKEDNLNFLESLFVIYKDKVIHKYLQGGQGNLSAEIIKSLCFMFPPLCEQEKIAEILGAWDLAIEKLTALIEQKKLLKKGLMQRLLTGKQRLPGFSTPWKKFEFDAIFYTEKGIKNKQIQTKEYQTKGRFPIVDQGKQKIIAYTDDENKLYKCTPVIVFGDHTRILKFITFHFVIGADGTQLIKTYSEYSLVFCFYVLQNISIPNLGYSRHMSVLKEKVFNLPPLPEQKAIADILSKADEEIDLLTRKLDLLQSQKKGLMQQLLTGKIRVKVA